MQKSYLWSHQPITAKISAKSLCLNAWLLLIALVTQASGYHVFHQRDMIRFETFRVINGLNNYQKPTKIIQQKKCV